MHTFKRKHTHLVFKDRQEFKKEIPLYDVLASNTILEIVFIYTPPPPKQRIKDHQL